MRRFSKISLIIIFILVICYIPSVDADQTATSYGPEYTSDKEYEVHVQIVIRDKNNQLVAVAESTSVEHFQTYLPNGDQVPQWIDMTFDRILMENYQSVIINDEKYEKVQFSLSSLYEKYRLDHFSHIPTGTELPVSDQFLKLCNVLQVHGHTCITSFVAKAPMYFLQEDYVMTQQWTLLRIIS
jgi:hypothetical protein